MILRSFGQRFLTLAILCSFVFAGAGCTKGPSSETVALSQPQTLEIWAVVDDVDVYTPLLRAYRQAHPHISLIYKRFRLEEYEEALLNAMAEDRGPDVFLIHNTWIGKYLSKLEPMPPKTDMVYQIVEGSSTNRKVTLELREEPSITIRELKNNYPDTVSQDVIRPINITPKERKATYEDQIVAIPMSLDTLAMYVNKDMLNAAGIPVIPEDWSRFQESVRRLVKIDPDGEILQAGSAMGLVDNVERPTDLLSILMMQNGTQMVNEQGYPTFSLMPEALSGLREELPAIEALQFYADFADPGKDIYTWNEDMPDALDAFVQGRLAYFFGYAYHLPTIKARAPKLNLAIASLPQISGNPIINYANYWTWTVSQKSKYTDTAWNFINYMIQPDNQKLFLDAARRPPADKRLIETYLEDEEMAVFASQILTSQSWYRGSDPNAMERTMEELILDFSSADPEDYRQVLKNAQSKVNQTIQPREYAGER